MILKPKNKKRTGKDSFSAAKDKVFKALASLLEVKGFKVRREELKAGPGWRASSGSCRAKTDKLIFVERRLPQDEQLNFLTSTALDCKVVFLAEELSSLPEATRNMLLGNTATI